MSKRRICLTAKSYSLPYLDVSPSKKRSVRRRTLSTSLKVIHCQNRLTQREPTVKNLLVMMILFVLTSLKNKCCPTLSDNKSPLTTGLKFESVFFMLL